MLYTAFWPNSEIKHVTRLVNRFFKAEGITKEYKGTDFSKGRSKNMAKRITNLIDAHPYVKIGAITARKTNAPKPIIDNNEGVVLYNHMMQRTICPHLIGMDNVTLIPDERSVPRGSKNSCFDLIKHELWLCQNSTATLEYKEGDSKNSEELMFIDWIANFVWRHHEDNQSDAYHLLSRHLDEDHLFF